jgi:hypothetical protein
MKRKLFITAFLLIFGAMAVFATDISGKWKGKVAGPDGTDMELTFVFKVDGQTLTGTIGSEMGEMAISQGKVNGEEFEYVLDLNGMVIKNKGKVSGEELKITSSGDWGESEITVKKVVE